MNSKRSYRLARTMWFFLILLVPLILALVPAQVEFLAGNTGPMYLVLAGIVVAGGIGVLFAYLSSVAEEREKGARS